MKNLKKFALFAALCGVFAGCGSDSGSNSNGSELPESIKNFSDIADYDCNDARQCAKLYVEEYSDTMQCVNGEWETLISSMKNACADSSVIPGNDRGSSSSLGEVIQSSSHNESSSSSVESSSEESSSSFSGIDPSTVVKGTMTDERDGKVYKTVTIGTQTWMAENLNYAYNVATSTEDSSSFCYNNSANSCAKFGRLYLWSAAMDSAAVFGDDGKGCGYGTTCSTSGIVRGVCPEGWHLPDTTEWRTLFSTVGGMSSAGTMLKSISGWNDDGNGEDSFGFSVLPAGYRYSNGYFNYAGIYADFWSSTENYSDYAYGWYFYYYYAYVGKFSSNKGYAFSVRCVKDSD